MVVRGQTLMQQHKKTGSMVSVGGLGQELGSLILISRSFANKTQNSENMRTLGNKLTSAELLDQSLSGHGDRRSPSHQSSLLTRSKLFARERSFANTMAWKERGQ